MNISKRERTLIIIVLVLAILCVYYIFLLKPYMDEVGELKLEAETKQIESETDDQQLKQIAEYNRQIELKRSEIAEFSKDIAQGFDQPPVLVYLEETVGESAQKMMFSFGNLKQVGQMNICPVTITMISNYDGVKQLIENFSTGDFIIRVTSMNAMQTSAMQTAIEEENEAPAEGEQPTQEPTQKVSINDLMDIDDPLEVTLTIEIYNIGGEIPSDKVYEFDDDSHNYGGDIFY